MYTLFMIEAFVLMMFSSYFIVEILEILLPDKPIQITEREIADEIIKMKEEQRIIRMLKRPPPYLSWYNPTTGEMGSNQSEIERWHKEHYDWMPDSH